MQNIQIIFLFCLILKIINDCAMYNDLYLCSNMQNYDWYDWDNRCFQTPPKGANEYYETYQDMHYLMGYAKMKYSADKTYCTITFYTKINPEINLNDGSTKLIFVFGEVEQESNIFVLDSSQKFPYGFNMSAKIKINDETKYQLKLEEEYFIWDSQEVNKNDTIYENGQKGSIVELFGWPYDDIAEECDFLKTAGYLGVKITPPNEHLFDNWIEDEGMNPWKYFYQTVSYKLNYTRLGTKRQLKSMIDTCRRKGIRIYSTVVINQMTYNGNDVYKAHYNPQGCKTGEEGDWGRKAASSGSPFYTIKGRNGYNPNTNKIPIFEYPSVPYCGTDFRCQIKDGDIENIWVDNGDLLDLDTGKDYVRERISDFLTELISIGISGFSVFTAKYIHINDYFEIFKKFNENLGNSLPNDFFVIFEMDSSDNAGLFCNNNNKNFGNNLKEKLRNIFSEEDVKKFKIQVEGSENKLDNICSYTNWIEQERFVMFLENYNNQRADSNNVRNKITSIDEHRKKYCNMFNDKSIDSKIRIIFSSYSLAYSGGTGFPDGFSNCTGIPDCKSSVGKAKAYEALSTGYDTGDITNWIFGNYTRVHRDIFIVNSMRTFMGLVNLTEDELYRYERYKVFGFPTTIPTTIETTIPTTIPTTILTTIPTTIQTTIQTTIPTSTPTILPTTIPTTGIFISDKISISQKITSIDSTIINNEKKTSHLNILTNSIYISDKNSLNTIKVSTNIATDKNKENVQTDINTITNKLSPQDDITTDKSKISDNSDNDDVEITNKKTIDNKDDITSKIIKSDEPDKNSEHFTNTNVDKNTDKTKEINTNAVTNEKEEFKTDNYDLNEKTDKINENKESDIIGIKDTPEESSQNIVSDSIIKNNLTNLLDYDDDICTPYTLENTNLNTDKIQFSKFKPMKCYKLVFSLENLKKNKVSLLLFLYLFLYLIFLIIYIIQGIDPLILYRKFDVFAKFPEKTPPPPHVCHHEKDKNKKNKKKDDKPHICHHKIHNYTDNKKNKKPNKVNKVPDIPHICHHKMKNNFLETETNSKNKSERSASSEREKINVYKKYKSNNKIKPKSPPKKKQRQSANINKKKKCDSSNETLISKKSKIKKNYDINILLANKKSIFSSKNIKNKIKFQKKKKIIILKKYVPNKEKLSDYELNHLEFAKAQKKDKRSFCKTYWSILKREQIIFFIFCSCNDYNLLNTKIARFIFILYTSMAMNVLFFLESTIDKIYQNNSIYDLVQNIPQILISAASIIVIEIFVCYFTLTDKHIYKVKSLLYNDKFVFRDDQILEIYKCIKIKLNIYFIISFLFILFYWYFVTAFCRIYEIAQITLIINHLLSKLIPLFYPFFLYLLATIMRVVALNKSLKCLYDISHIIPVF